MDLFLKKKQFDGADIFSEKEMDRGTLKKMMGQRLLQKRKWTGALFKKNDFSDKNIDRVETFAEKKLTGGNFSRKK